MDLADVTLERAARTGAHLLGGAIGTAVAGLGLLRAGLPLQARLYDTFYLAVGPWTAEVTATVMGFTLAATLALALPTLLSVGVESGTEHLRPLLAGLAVLLAVLAAWLSASALLGVEGLLAALLGLALVLVAIPAGLHRFASWPDGVAAFVGGVPVVALLVAALAFGLGWGGGYVLVAEEVPADAVDGSPAADVSEEPELRDDLLDPSDDDVYANCERDDRDRRTCRLDLRGYDGEATAARFMASHGVRCPYRNVPSRDRSEARSFVAEDDGTYYRITCEAYGD